jgi:hypothetical protein
MTRQKYRPVRAQSLPHVESYESTIDQPTSLHKSTSNIQTLSTDSSPSSPVILPIPQQNVSVQISRDSVSRREVSTKRELSEEPFTLDINAETDAIDDLATSSAMLPDLSAPRVKRRRVQAPLSVEASESKRPHPTTRPITPTVNSLDESDSANKKTRSVAGKRWLLP